MNSIDHHAAFHAGERQVQASIGVETRMAAVGAVAIRDHMPQQHRDFLSLLPFLVLGSIDADAQPSASLLTGAPGFVSSPDERLLHVAALPSMNDPLRANLQQGAALGVLGIQPHTRRRNRVNGSVVAFDEQGFSLAVEQSFGNCPKYIHTREAIYTPQAIVEEMVCTEGLSDDACAVIAQADTCFIASAHPDAHVSGARAQGVDVSHRGGSPGFIRISASGTLLLPDYSGNRFFNTLGNLVLNPKAGVMILDYHNGDIWQFDVWCQILSDAEQIVQLFEGAERLLICDVLRTRRHFSAASLRWQSLEKPRVEEADS